MSNLIETRLALTDGLSQCSDLYFDGKIIELRSGTNQRREPFKYQTHCFTQISQSEEDRSLFIGPGFIDHILSRGMPHFSKPDAIKLNVSSPEEWTLTDLFEFKSGKNIGPLKKIRGFSLLLKRMRERPDYLPTLLQSTVDDFGLVPDTITIPPDDQITVTFVSPKVRKGIVFHQDAPSFRVQHMLIPF